MGYRGKGRRREEVNNVREMPFMVHHSFMKVLMARQATGSAVQHTDLHKLK